jgi:hypothetical protein
MMRSKLRKLRELLERSLIDRYPGGVEIVCPDGILALAQNSPADWSHGNNDPKAEDETPPATTTGMDFRAWWTELDNVNRYQALHESLEFLADILRRNPVDGIIGFSQGATLATMLTAICEGGPKRMRALSTQGDPINMPPPQAPFKFALLSCGHKGTDKYYSGFYNPRLRTPMFFDIAEYDHMIEPATAKLWSTVSHHSQRIIRPSGHWFSTSHSDLRTMVRFITDSIADDRHDKRLACSTRRNQIAEAEEPPKCTAACSGIMCGPPRNVAAGPNKGCESPPLAILPAPLPKSTQRARRMLFRRTRKIHCIYI